MAEINKRNIIKSKYPKAKCFRLKGNQSHYIVNLGGPEFESAAVGRTPSQAWALAYLRLRAKGRL